MCSSCLHCNGTGKPPFQLRQFAFRCCVTFFASSPTQEFSARGDASHCLFLSFSCRFVPGDWTRAPPQNDCLIYCILHLVLTPFVLLLAKWVSINMCDTAIEVLSTPSQLLLQKNRLKLELEFFFYLRIISHIYFHVVHISFLFFYLTYIP